LCTALPGKPQALLLQQRLPLTDNEFAYIYAVTNSVSLWDYGINKFNCITVSVQFMLELKNNKHNTYYPCTYLYIVNAVIFKLLLTSHLKCDLAKKQQQR